LLIFDDGPANAGSCLQAKTCFAGAVCQGFYPAVVQISAAIKFDLFNASRFCSFRNQFADCNCLFRFGTCDTAGTGCCQRVTFQIINNLAINRFTGAIYTEARPLRRAAYFLADTHVNALTTLLFGAFHCCFILIFPDFRPGKQLLLLATSRFTSFATDDFALEHDTLSFVRFGFAEAPDFGANLSE
jgi:hypothetical protein